MMNFQKDQKEIIAKSDISDMGYSEITNIADIADITVEAGEAGERIDRYLASQQLFPLSRSYAEKLLEDGNIMLNGNRKKASYRIKEGDVIHLEIPKPRPLLVEAEDIPLDIIYEDRDLLIVNKQKGMVVHPSAGHENGTLVNAILCHCGEDLSSINGVLRPGIVHRIDKDTTGLLLVCKNDRTHKFLAEQLKVHSINRKYVAIVSGIIKSDEGTIDAPIGRDVKNRKKQAIDFHRGKRAVTHYKVKERLKGYSLIECTLETGRTHQIRVHLQSIGHPVLGDPVYGLKKCPFKLEGQCLHAMTIGFIHPSDGSYKEFNAPYPEYFSKLLASLR